MLKLSLLLVAGVAAAGAATAAPSASQAAWTQHDLVIHLRHLPKAYPCNDLWYKFRDVLQAIGARPEPEILVYQCGPGLGVLAFSPEVHLHFAIAQPLTDTQSRLADVSVRPRTVRLEPGQPTSINATDCELLRQMKNGLLAVLPDRVVSFQLACDAPQTRYPFNVSIEMLAPVEGQARVAAASRADPR
jgi:hypothetical protein